MASWQTTALNVALHLTVKRMMNSSGSVEATRKFIESRRRRPVPPGCRIEPVACHSFRGEWVTSRHSSEARTLLYLPGGGFMLPASAQIPSLVARLSRHAGTRGMIVHYRLAPEHPFPAGLNDCLAAYRHLLDLGTDPKSIVIAGDSAGGGLTLSTLLALRDAGDPLPAAAAVISPFTDFTFGGESRVENDRKDPILSNGGMEQMNPIYLRDTPPDHPLASPVYADFRGLPPILAHVGSTEVLLDDTRRVAQRARAQAVQFEVEVYDQVPHVWHLWRFLPESQQAVARIGAFMREHTAAVGYTFEPEFCASEPEVLEPEVLVPDLPAPEVVVPKAVPATPAPVRRRRVKPQSGI